jgi:hypothetical protein
LNAILEPTHSPMGSRDKQIVAAHATASWLIAANAQDNTIPATTPSCDINSDPDLNCGYDGGVNCDWSDSDSEYNEDYTDTVIPRNLFKYQPISICRKNAQVSMMQMFLNPKTSQMPTPEQSFSQPDDTGQKGQLESFEDQVDYLSNHPSEAENKIESDNSDTSSAECTAVAPPWKRKKLDVPYHKQRKQAQICRLEEMKE